jgi:hypothetical protein
MKGYGTQRVCEGRDNRRYVGAFHTDREAVNRGTRHAKKRARQEAQGEVRQTCSALDRNESACIGCPQFECCLTDDGRDWDAEAALAETQQFMETGLAIW